MVTVSEPELGLLIIVLITTVYVGGTDIGALIITPFPPTICNVATPTLLTIQSK